MRCRNTEEDSDERLNLSLALLPSDPSQIDYLKDRLLNARPEQVETIRSLLVDHKDMLAADLWRVAEQARNGENNSFKRPVHWRFTTSTTTPSGREWQIEWSKHW